MLQRSAANSPLLSRTLARCAYGSFITATASTGAARRAIFARFYRERIAKGPVEVVYRPLEHKGDAPAFPAECFDGDENACVDFRYSQDPRLTWWFDHHASAFQLAGDEAHFRADTTGRKFYDPGRQELHQVSWPTPWPRVRFRSGAAGRADRVGRDHRRRAVPRRRRWRSS